MKRVKEMEALPLLLSVLAFQATLQLQSAKADSGWRLLDNGTYVRVYGNQDAMGASGTQGSSGGEGSDTRENTDSGWVLSPRTRSSSSSRSFQQFRSSRTVPSPTTHCDDYEEHSPHCNNVGTYNCGLCKCSADFFGMNCECSAEAIPFGFDLEDSCRHPLTTGGKYRTTIALGSHGYWDNTALCNNRGDCTCGKCDCHPRENSNEVVFGDYCECDNYSCDHHNGELCSGEDHGECVCGQCNCHSEWDVEGYSACECRAGNETCITTFGEHIMKVCSGHGECKCGECRCEEKYSGRWCEECPTCNDKCEELKPCVQCQVFQSGELTRTEDGMGSYVCADQSGRAKCEFDSMVVPKAEDMVNANERICTFVDVDGCGSTFVYGFTDETGELQVWVEETKECGNSSSLWSWPLGLFTSMFEIFV